MIPPPDMSKQTELASARSIAWARRRAAVARFWHGYRQQRAGVVGLVLLLTIIVLAIAMPYITNADGLNPTRVDGGRLEPPSLRYPLGTDELGRSVLLLTLWGARVSLLVGVTATLLAMLIGTLVGIVAGHFGGRTSWVLMRLADWFIVVPTLVLAMVLLLVLGSSLFTIIVVIGVASWAGTARLIRAQTLAVEGRPYLERARALGAGHWHQMSRHVLPNVMPLVLASTTLQVASAILLESTLSFLGLGDPNQISWGTMLHRAYQAGAVSFGAWWYLLPSGLGILIVVLCFTLCGRALESVVNPRLRGGGR
jgi:peptide/nickel transport system permease protein